ncbi:hypothetical protein TOC8172_02750 [Pseudomonas syringae]
MNQSSDLIQSAQRTIRLEIEAIQGLLERLDGDFVRACEMILASKGRVVVVGMGKSGHVGKKNRRNTGEHRHHVFFLSTRPKPATVTWA